MPRTLAKTELSKNVSLKSQQAREAILQRLRAKGEVSDKVEFVNQASDFTLYENKVWSESEKLNKLIQHLTTAHAEIHSVEQSKEHTALKNSALTTVLQNLLTEKGVKSVLLSERITIENLQSSCSYQQYDYSKSIDDTQWQRTLFESIDASITTSVCAIAETGSIILVPDQIEPRLMSLVPPIHIVIVDKNKIYNTLFEAIQQEQWQLSGMPTNLVMISGPSKTADIEQTLAYGVHGPKELIVVLV